MASIKETVEGQLAESARVIAATAQRSQDVARMGEILVAAYKKGNKLLSFGNGGSACDAQNFADELVGRYERNRPGLPALSLTVNTSDLTSIGNDFGFDEVFARPLRAMAKPGDVAVAISTSGNSPNVLKAAQAARELGLPVLGLSGESGGKLKALCDVCLCVPSKTVARIQEAHIAVIQILCGIVEEAMFPDAPKAH
ncbi:MAG TPA: D-sedoheptulose 7-phosphate isomerase [Elusimicrobiota bacterium]|nr:D-sedoheptulose 7-phosphate isomerase [Elusimicrobiota bacterium]